MFWLFIAEPPKVSGQEKKVPSISDIGGKIDGDDDDVKNKERPTSPGRAFHPQWLQGGHSICTKLHLLCFTYSNPFQKYWI